jgi:hypothetical protein
MQFWLFLTPEWFANATNNSFPPFIIQASNRIAANVYRE